MSTNNIKKNSYKFFSNRDCEFFPCHKCSEKDLENFNCVLETQVCLPAF